MPTKKKQAAKPAKEPGTVHDVHEEKRPAPAPTGKPTLDQDNHDENVGQRTSQDEPYVIPPPHEEVE